MNETITTIALMVVTNWISVGELKTKDGKTFDVQEGRLQTNTVARVEWREQVSAEEMAKLGTTALGLIGNLHTNEFILKSVQGSVVAEKRVEITNVWITNIWIGPTNDWWSKGVWQTNKIKNGVILNRVDK